MYRAYESLPDALKQRASGLALKHDGTYNSGGYVRQGLAATDDPVSSSGVYHPLVRIHPETGRRALYLGRRRNAYIGGLPLAESEALLDELWSYATRDDIAWHNQWQAQATLSYGTTVAPCIGATHSIPTHAASCTARKSKARPANRRERKRDGSAPRELFSRCCASCT